MKVALVLVQHLGHQAQLRLPDLARDWDGQSLYGLCKKPLPEVPYPVALGELHEQRHGEGDFSLEHIAVCLLSLGLWCL